MSKDECGTYCKCGARYRYDSAGDKFCTKCTRGGAGGVVREYKTFGDEDRRTWRRYLVRFTAECEATFPEQAISFAIQDIREKGCYIEVAVQEVQDGD